MQPLIGAVRRATFLSMSRIADTRQPTFDPFGEPMGFSRARTDVAADRKGFGETRRAVVVFWALALLLLAGRVYLADQLAGPAIAAVPTSTVAAQVALLR